jgi:hypothetical protein
MCAKRFSFNNDKIFEEIISKYIMLIQCIELINLEDKYHS